MQAWQDLEHMTEEQFRLLVMNVPDVVWTTDEAGRTTFISPNVAKVYGFTPEEILRGGNRLFLERIHPEDAERVRGSYESLFAGSKAYDVEYRIQRKDGNWIWLHDRAVNTYEKDGVRYADGLFSDITTRKQAESQRDATLEALRTARDELELRVAERTAEIRRQNDFLAALHETALGIVGRLNVDEVLEAMVTRAADLFAGFASIYLVDPGTDELVARIASRPYREFVGFRLKRGAGLCGKVWQFDRPLWVEEYNRWEGRATTSTYPDPNVERSMGVPLHSGQEVVGVLGVSRPLTAPPFQQGEVDTAIRLANLASIALDNARLYSSVQRQLVELQHTQQALQQRLASEGLVARISTEFVNLGPAEIDTGIQHALRAIGQVAGVDRSYVFQFSGDGTILDNTHEWCAEGIQPYMDSLRGLSRTAFPWFVGRLEQLEVVAVPRVAEMPPEASRERAECEREGIQSIILVPLTYRGMLTGFLGFDSVRSERGWGEDTIALLKIAAGIIINALEHKRAQAVQAGQRQFLELLATGGDFFETLHTLVRLIEHEWPGMLGLILLLDEDGKHLHIGASVSLPQDYVQSIEGLEIGPMVGSCGTACYRRERVIVEDTATDPRWDGLRALALQYSLRACWSEPVFSPAGQVVGTFAMYYRQPRAPTEAELRAIEMGAHLVGVAIEHDRAETALRQSEEKFRGIVEYANVGIAIVQDARFRFVNAHFAAMLGYAVEEMLGTEFMPYCTPEERERIVDFYTRRARGEPAPPRYETAMVHKNGGHVYAEVSAGLIPYGGQQATFVFLRDITEEKQAKRALVEAYQTLEQRVVDRTHELSTLLEVSKNLVSRLELEPLLGSILDELRSVVDYEGCILFALEGEQLVPLAHRGPTPQEKAMSLRFGVDDPLDRLVLGGREPVLVSDTRGDGPMAQAYRESLGDLQETLYPHIRSWLGVPLIVKGEVIGELALDHSHPAFFTPAHASFAMAFANQAAVAIENARLYEAEQERTRELAALNAIAAVVSRSLGLNERMSRALDMTLEVMGLEMGVAYRLEGEPGDPPPGPVLRLMARRGITKDLARLIDRLPLHGSFVEHAAVIQRPLVWTAADYPQVGLRQYLDRAGVQTGVSVPLLSKERMVGAIVLGAPGRRLFSPETLSLLFAIGQQVGVAVENARLYEAEQERREESERRRQVAEGMREILAVLNSRQSLNDMLDLIATHACRVLGSDAAALLRLDRATGLLGIQATCNLDAEYALQISMPLGVGTAGRALAERRPVVISDTAEAAVYLEAGGSDRPEIVPGLLKQLAGRFCALFSVPIIVKDEAHGAITFYYREPHSFSEEEFRLALSVANQAALALENARLRAQAEESAAMEERGRLARELHDSVTQSLYSVTMFTEAAARRMATDQEAAAGHLRDARDTAQEALREMRLLIYQLRPPVLKQGSLAVALQVRLDAVERRGGIQAELMVEGEDRLPPAVQAELHQIAQEALNNALKHAHAGKVQVRLHFGDAATRLEVRDDGLGFDFAAAQAGGGLGLPGMRERAHKLGGWLEIESVPGKGTEVIVEVPTGGEG